MGRHRRVDCAVWNDRKFRSFDDATKLLWLNLLTTPNMLPIPGVIPSGEAGIAEVLGWSSERLREPFRELLRERMIKADLEARLVWLPNAIRRNPPANPNAVTSWAKYWDDVPESPLKHEIWQSLKRLAERLPDRFKEPFTEQFPEPFPTREVDREVDLEVEVEKESLRRDAASESIADSPTSEPDRTPQPRKRGRTVSAKDLPQENFDLETELEALGENASLARDFLGALISARKRGLSGAVTQRTVRALASAHQDNSAALGHGLGVVLDKGDFDWSRKAENALAFVKACMASYRPNAPGRRNGFSAREDANRRGVFNTHNLGDLVAELEAREAAMEKST